MSTSWRRPIRNDKCGIGESIHQYIHPVSTAQYSRVIVAQSLRCYGSGMTLHRLLVMGLFLAALSAEASTMVSVTSASSFPGAGVNINSANQISWTQSGTYQNIAIQIPLYSGTPNEAFHVTAYLTTGSGPGTLPPPLATSTFSSFISRRRMGSRLGEK